MEQVLKGIRIIDFSWVLAGPLITGYLAAYGAEVIKVESRDRPDLLRLTQPYKDGIPGVDRSGAFTVANNNKLSVTLNLSLSKARELAKRLVAKADIVVENFRPGVMAKWGLDYDSLVKIKPNIIMLSVSPRGQTGPLRAVPGFGFNFSALAGTTSLTGWPDRPPSGTTQAYPDAVAPWFGTVALLAALDYRRKTGEGQYIDIAQYEVTLQFLTSAVLEYTANRTVTSRRGNRSDRMAPHGVYRCKGDDRWCAIAVATDEEWGALCRAIGAPALTEDTRFATFESRKINEDELDRIIERWTVTLEAEQLMILLQEASVRAGVVKTLKDLYEDPQLAYQGHFPVVNHPEMGTCFHYGYPARLSKTPPHIEPAPCLGLDNYHALHDIVGMSDEEFSEYLNAGVFG